tara:strand:+ start:338 stop:1486 length:1149 start_codon:yes stop_codon:yes gene_type:complete
MKIKLSLLPTILFGLQIFIRRLFVIPSSYLVPYIYFSIPKISNITFFYFIYSFYSFVISTDKISTLIYSILFILNTFAYNALKDPKESIKIKIREFNEILKVILIISSIFSLLLWILNLNILPNPIFLTLFNPLNALNINSYIFILYYFSFAAMYLNNGKDLFLGGILLLITDSRTGLIFLIFLILQVLDNQKLLPSLKKINLKLIIPIFISTLFITPIFLSTGFLDNIKHNFNTSLEFADNLLINKEKIQRMIKENNVILQDHQRLCLTINNLNHIEKTFPKGTGIGLKSYLNSLKKNNLGCKAPFYEENLYIRAHNFYISYLAEMGIFFIPLILFLFLKLRNRNSGYIITGLLIGFLGHEYLTSPYTWMIIGLSERCNYD